MNLSALFASKPPVKASIPVQITALADKQAGNGNPYLEAKFGDGTGELSLKIWNNMTAYAQLKLRKAGEFVSLGGDFTKTDFGWESKNLLTAVLSDEDVATLLEGDPDRRAFLDGRWKRLNELVESMADTALRKTTQRALNDFGDRFRRAAAARGNHHARRGGLLEHVTEMAEIADGICRALPHLNRSLVLAGVVFHDIGKILENQYEEKGFTMPYDFAAELCGHIAIGFQVVVHIWTACGYKVTDERLIVLRHLILSHHGQLDFGSPVEPKCPEAAVLHYIDQISAKTEMFKTCYQQPEVAPGLHDRCYPLKVIAARVPAEINEDHAQP